MKRVDLVKRLEKGGCKLLRHGAKHDIYFNPDKGLSQPRPAIVRSMKGWPKRLFAIYWSVNLYNQCVCNAL